MERPILTLCGEPEAPQGPSDKRRVPQDALRPAKDERKPELDRCVSPRFPINPGVGRSTGAVGCSNGSRTADGMGR